MGKHILKFYPIGNADTSLIKLDNGKSILWDFANVRDDNDENDKRYDIVKDLDEEVKDDFDVVCFTHGDRDHTCGLSEYFYLEHAKKYQSSDRKKIDELWVPASVLLDKEAKDDAKILKAEARYRLKEKSGIKVFSRPDKMKDWCDEQDDISYDDVKGFFVDAGTTVNTFSLKNDGIEFFVHSPFASNTESIDRNGDCIVVQVTFHDDCSTKVMLGADAPWDAWVDIIKITKNKKREVRLEWDIFRNSHHSSYLSLSDDKGVDKTKPKKDIEWLFETKGNEDSLIVSSSKPIPIKNSGEDKDNNPPHRQAAAYYKDVAKDLKGEYQVTMEFPKESSPSPIVVEVDKKTCWVVKKTKSTTTAAIATKTPPRAG